MANIFKNHATLKTAMVLNTVTVQSVVCLQIEFFWIENFYSVYIQHLIQSDFSYQIVISTATEIKNFPDEIQRE